MNWEKFDKSKIAESGWWILLDAWNEPAIRRCCYSDYWINQDYIKSKDENHDWIWMTPFAWPQEGGLK